MFQRYLERIEKIADFLAKVPHPDQAIEFLSLNISPIDEVAVAYRGIIDPDGAIRCVNIKGFSKNEIITKTQLNLSDNRPISVSARTQKLIWARFETVSEEFPDFYHFDRRTPWESQVSFPVGLTRVYSFSFPTDHSNHEGMNSYIESVP